VFFQRPRYRTCLFKRNSSQVSATLDMFAFGEISTQANRRPRHPDLTNGAVQPSAGKVIRQASRVVDVYVQRLVSVTKALSEAAGNAGASARAAHTEQ
jgi:hypothetical protein